MSTMIDADAARREGFVPLGASRKGSSFRGGRAAANDTAAEIGSLGKGHKPVWKSNFGRPTPSARRTFRSCGCSMAWRLTKVHAK